MRYRKLPDGTRRWTLRLVVLALSIASSATNTCADCVNVAPVAKVDAEVFYSDKAGSVVDRELLNRHLSKIRDLRAFATELSEQTDKGEIGCAREMLARWARNDAMMTQPDAFPGIRERARFTISIILSAIKLKQRDARLPEVVTNWLEALTGKIVRDFGGRPVIDNLFVWSGVAAESFLRLKSSKSGLEYSDAVWTAAVRQIAPNGTLQSEARRGSRSGLYHQYYLSGLILMREMRHARGVSPSSVQDASLHRLTAHVESVACWPPPGEERPPSSEFRIIAAFGNVRERRLLTCVRSPVDDKDPIYGGSLERLKASLYGTF